MTPHMTTADELARVLRRKALGMLKLGLAHEEWASELEAAALRYAAARLHEELAAAPDTRSLACLALVNMARVCP